MKRGIWHQFGHNSQTKALDLIQNGFDQGVILSPVNLKSSTLIENADKLNNFNIDILLDQQFYVPDSKAGKLPSYNISIYRKNKKDLMETLNKEITQFQRMMYDINNRIRSKAILSPGVIYESSDLSIEELNNKLFEASKNVGDSLGIPTYGTIIIGRSAISSPRNIASILSKATALNADGWYFAFEFTDERIASNADEIFNFLKAGLSLACKGKPILHAFAGPMGLLSYAFGATGVGIGHSQNLWTFTRQRWLPRTKPRGGNGKNPPKFFSKSLWGHMIYRDEITRLSDQQLKDAILTHSLYSKPVKNDLDWSKDDASNHFLAMLFEQIQQISQTTNIRQNIEFAIKALKSSQSLQRQIEKPLFRLSDWLLDCYPIWIQALERFSKDNECSDDIDYLEMLL